MKHNKRLWHCLKLSKELFYLITVESCHKSQSQRTLSSQHNYSLMIYSTFILSQKKELIRNWVLKRSGMITERRQARAIFSTLNTIACIVCGKKDYFVLPHRITSACAKFHKRNLVIEIRHTAGEHFSTLKFCLLYLIANSHEIHDTVMKKAVITTWDITATRRQCWIKPKVRNCCWYSVMWLQLQQRKLTVSDRTGTSLIPNITSWKEI